jgi:DNA-binding NtrC family response regulator
MMKDLKIHVLLVEDNPDDALLLRESLLESGGHGIQIKCVERLNQALEGIQEQDFDVILLDLSLPDSHGLETLQRAHIHAPQIPIVVLTGLNDEELAIEAVRQGAQDYIVKGQAAETALLRALRYAVERHRLQIALRNQSMTDELIGAVFIPWPNNSAGFRCAARP